MKSRNTLLVVISSLRGKTIMSISELVVPFCVFRVRELENWSYIRRFKDPVYDYTRQENRVSKV